MQCSVFNLTFQIVIYHPITRNNYNNVAPSVLLLYNDTTGVVLNDEQPFISQFSSGIIKMQLGYGSFMSARFSRPYPLSLKFCTKHRK